MEDDMKIYICVWVSAVVSESIQTPSFSAHFIVR